MNNVYGNNDGSGSSTGVPMASAPQFNADTSTQSSQIYRSAASKDLFFTLLFIVAIGFEIYYMVLAFGLANSISSNVNENGVQFTYMSTALQVL